MNCKIATNRKNTYYVSIFFTLTLFIIDSRIRILLTLCIIILSYNPNPIPTNAGRFRGGFFPLIDKVLLFHCGHDLNKYVLVQIEMLKCYYEQVLRSERLILFFHRKTAFLSVHRVHVLYIRTVKFNVMKIKIQKNVQIYNLRLKLQYKKLDFLM